MLFNITKLKDMNEDNIMIYHNHIHQNKIIYGLLTSFFGPLSVVVMEYIGIIRDDQVYVPSLDDCKKDDARIKHKDSVVIQNYVFQMEEDDF